MLSVYIDKHLNVKLSIGIGERFHLDGEDRLDGNLTN